MRAYDLPKAEGVGTKVAERIEGQEIYKERKCCRVCGTRLERGVVDLGMQAMTGIFPKDAGSDPPFGPLSLGFCSGCTLVQLCHDYDSGIMYGENYGYRSGLNKSMVAHLEKKVSYLKRLVGLEAGDWVLDIGSNDGTSLNAYGGMGLNRVGIDPTSEKFLKYYEQGIDVVHDFFSAENYWGVSGGEKAKLVTSIAMFYDLEDPVAFAKGICEVLDDEGVWHFEQSYLPAMLRTSSYDTICQEHLLYYSVHSIERILDRAGMKILDLSFNDVNGGSFAVSAVKKGSERQSNDAVIEWAMRSELMLGVTGVGVFERFQKKIDMQRDLLLDLLMRIKRAGQMVVGYGASTKGNVLLQYSGIDEELVRAVGEINPDKFGCVTPGSHIPILSDGEVREMKPDYFLVLPWHFRNDILGREQGYMNDGGHFIFPLPEVEVV